ncbi:hypothetical protein TNIN_394661 [Trichonephila inaurata madagascariensis]|uniref:Uncharacterized protein n=1 Tax=Trichonephila inaurata madagascariensis TaxID=2747483 RepID=A0A8X6XYZ9_9ARAC|nr:hypothetical protein TNIN_394661 [Trichonephila inaurata madagascariensis]
MILSEESVGSFNSKGVKTGPSNAVCGPKHFECGNTTRYIEHCDGIQHCDEGEDEEGSDDAYGSLDSLLKAIGKHRELKDVLLDESFDNCSK